MLPYSVREMFCIDTATNHCAILGVSTLTKGGCIDGSLSWRAQLAKTNINILNLSRNDDGTVIDVFYEFMYHPKPGQTKWCKTYTQSTGEITDDEHQLPVTGDDLARDLKREALSLRKELEG